jgi:hypothetical protein
VSSLKVFYFFLNFKPKHKRNQVFFIRVEKCRLRLGRDEAGSRDGRRSSVFSNSRFVSFSFEAKTPDENTDVVKELLLGSYLQNYPAAIVFRVAEFSSIFTILISVAEPEQHHFGVAVTRCGSGGS